MIKKKKKTCIKEHMNQSIIGQWEYMPHKKIQQKMKKEKLERERKRDDLFV